MNESTGIESEVSIVDEALRLGTGFADSEREHVVERLAQLDHRLRSYEGKHIELEIHVKERDGADQHVTLECHIAHLPRMVATSTLPEIDAALADVREDMIRQIGDYHDKHDDRRHGR